jgi:hypothetical protein
VNSVARPALGFLAAALLLSSGCLDASGPSGSEVRGDVPAVGAILALDDTVLVSAPGHRIAEFMVQRNPNDPDHLVTAYGDYDSYGGVLNCGFSVSFDGGASWRVSGPVPDLSGPYLGFDGWVDFDEWGGVHAICIQQVGPEAEQTEAWPFYFSSDEGGLTWSEAMRIPTDPPGRSTDKSVLAVGRDGTVYGAVSGLVGSTKDNGTTWRTMAPVEEGFAVLNGMVEDNQGAIFLLGLGGGDDVWLQRTTDGGLTWQRAVIGQFHIPPGYNDQNRFVDQRPWTALPTLAHDPLSDELWVAYQSWDTAYNGYKLHAWRSTDHGASFKETAVPDFRSPLCPDPCHVTHPSLAFDLQGRVGLTVQLTMDQGLVKVVQFSASDDHGATWSDPFELSATTGSDSWQNPNAFTPDQEALEAYVDGVKRDPASAKGQAAGLALTTLVSELQMRWNGEYWGVAASSKGFVAMWIDHSADGRPQLYSRLLDVDA